MIYKQIKKIPEETIKEKLDIFFKEDQSQEDITTNTFVDYKKEVKGLFIAEFSGVFCGINVIENGFSKNVKIKSLIQDGFKVKPEMPLAIIQGPAHEILRKERVILNLIQRMSGISTETNQYASKGFRKNIKILDTRKTTPGIRMFEKYAVQCGGGKNHRFNLAKGVMIKDNHLSVGENIEKTLSKIKNLKMPIQIEIDTRDQLIKSLNYDIDAVLLDNMEPEQNKECVSLIKSSEKKVFIEVSGGITLKTLNRFLIAGVDAISVGSIIHQATFKNIKLQFD